MAPMPCIFKGFNLCFRCLTALILEQHVVIAVGVDRWVSRYGFDPLSRTDQS
jgi:hypothetical protein